MNGVSRPGLCLRCERMFAIAVQSGTYQAILMIPHRCPYAAPSKATA